MYQRVLSQDEIKQNFFQAPIVTDGLVLVIDSGNIISYETGSTTTYSLTGSLTGSLINGVGYNQNNGGSWVFDGTDDYINFPDDSTLNFGTGSFTIECFFRPKSTQSGGNYPAILDKSTGDFTDSPLLGSIGWIIFWDTLSNVYRFRLRDGTTSNDINFPGSINNDNTWRCLSVSIPNNGSSIIGYHNGISIGSVTRTVGSTSTNVALNIARWRQFTRELNTDVGIVRIYNHALSAQEIAQNFNAQRTRFNI
jgi:hypothetical protein